MTIQDELKDYQTFKSLLDISKTIVEDNQEFQKKPLLQMMEAKYLLFHLNNREEAKEMYFLASQTALFLGDTFLQSQILSERDKDLTLA